MRDRLGELLQLLEREMRAQGRWETSPPPAAALASTQPFAVDTLDFDQWLQWIFIARLRELLSLQMPLPAECAVRPMAEEVYHADDEAATRLICLLGEIDVLFQAHHSGLN